MKTVIVRKINRKTCEHLEFHHIQIPDVLEPNFYRTIISYSAFFESTKRAKRQAPWLFYVDDRLEGRRQITDYEINRDAALPVIQHEDLYKFFNHIGYCRNKKRITC